MQQSKPEWAIRFHRRINLGEHPRYRAAPSLPELPLLRGCLPTRNNTASGSDSSLSTRRRERERETPLIRRRRRMRFNIGWPVRGRGQLGKGSWSRWDTRTYDPRPLLVPLTNVSWHPPGTALLLEGRRHPLTRDSAVSVTRGREPNLIPSHPCSRRPWRPFNYWRDCARVSWSRII